MAEKSAAEKTKKNPVVQWIVTAYIWWVVPIGALLIILRQTGVIDLPESFVTLLAILEIPLLFIALRIAVFLLMLGLAFEVAKLLLFH